MGRKTSKRGNITVLPDEFEEGVSDEFGRLCDFAARLIEGLGIEEDVSGIPGQCRKSPADTHTSTKL